MESPNRIAGTTITTTVGRQTPKDEFGQVLVRGAATAVSTGAELARAFAGNNGVVSAAVTAVENGVHAAIGHTAGVTGGGAVAAQSSVGAGTSSVGAAAGAGGKGEQWDLLEAQKALNAEGQKFNAAYLQLQNSMQKESREFQAVSNIMKVRHDSAKAAINNIR